LSSISPEERRELMRRFRSRDTRPEVCVRRALHAAGRRFRLHRKDLPGRPDIVLPKDNVAIFVNGCFWHAHEGCPISRTPSTKTEFWKEKFARNRERDARVQDELRAMGWKAVTIWECEVPNVEAAEARIRELGLV